MDSKLVISLISVVVGFFLGQSANIIRDLFATRCRKKNIRELVSLEVGENLKRLAEYGHELTMPPGASADDLDDEEEGSSDNVSEDKRSSRTPLEHRTWYLTAKRCGEIPFPNLSNMVWSSHVNELASVFTKHELQALWNLYDGIQRLPLLHTEVCSAFKDNPEEEWGDYQRSPAGLRASGTDSIVFGNKAASIGHDFNALLKWLMDTKNPLSS